MVSWDSAFHRPNPYFKLNTASVVSGIVQVIRENVKGGFQIGSPLLGSCRQGSVHITRHPRGVQVRTRRQATRI
jgi:hypothetical protein